MIGVVVWSNRAREQAVIWCDDHAALAYLVGRNDFPTECAWPEPGDMLELETAVEGDLRCARQARPLGDSTVPQLPKLLNTKSARLSVVKGTGAAAVNDAEILPLPRRVLAAG